jgi:hypothetical protein
LFHFWSTTHSPFDRAQSKPQTGVDLAFLRDCIPTMMGFFHGGHADNARRECGNSDRLV